MSSASLATISDSDSNCQRSGPAAETSSNARRFRRPRALRTSHIGQLLQEATQLVSQAVDVDLEGTRTPTRCPKPAGARWRRRHAETSERGAGEMAKFTLTVVGPAAAAQRCHLDGGRHRRPASVNLASQGVNHAAVPSCRRAAVGRFVVLAMRDGLLGPSQLQPCSRSMPQPDGDRGGLRPVTPIGRTSSRVNDVLHFNLIVAVVFFGR